MKIFLNVGFASLLCLNAFAEHYVSSQDVAMFDGAYNLVDSGVIISPSYPNTISMNMSMDLENCGVIDANIDAGAYNLRLYNSGEINGSVFINHDWALTQIVRSDAEFTSLDVIGGKWILNLDGLQNADIDVIQNSGADKFVLNDASVLIDDFAKWRDWNADILLNGENTLYISNSYTVNSGEEIAHVTDISNINVVLTDVDNLHKALVESSYDGKALLYIVRETDYSKIFNDKRGILLQELRLNSPDDKLFSVMDAANNIGELQNAMNLSYRFNHDILMRPIRVINNFNMTNMFMNTNEIAVGIIPEYIFGNNTSAAGLNLFARNSYNGFNFSIGTNINKIHYTDDINDLGGMILGLNFGVRKDIDNFWINTMFGGNIAKFKADYIYVNDDIKNNPTGSSLYGALDVGYNYTIFNNLALSPFVGSVFQKLSVLDYDDTNMNLRFGGSATYNFVVENIKYEYGATVGVVSNGDMFGKLKIGFLSLIDMAGADVVFDMFDDEFGTNYRASINAKIIF